MKFNKYELSTIGFIIIIFLAFGYYVQPFSPSPSEQKLETKIEVSEAYLDEAKAISLSMPLLNDSIIAVYADSLFVTLVTLNRDWVIFVTTEEGFEKYTEKIDDLNGDIDGLRLEYTHELIMRRINRTILRNKEFQKKWKQEPEKYETDGTGKFV